MPAVARPVLRPPAPGNRLSERPRTRIALQEPTAVDRRRPLWVESGLNDSN